MIAALLPALGALLAISGAVGSRLANVTTFNDASGDASEGPDLTQVRVTTRDDGQLIFEITVPNREGLLGTESIQLFVDTDRNGATGSNGADFAFAIFARTGRVFIDKWTGTSFSRQRQSLDSGFSPRALTLRGRQTEFALSSYIDFWIVTYSRYDGPGTGVVGDRTPRWRHSLTPAVATTARAPSAPTDTDGDGVPDTSDRCVTRSGGAFDFNRNGCPGPFRRMAMFSLTYPQKTFNDETWWTPERPPVLSVPAPRARVEIDDGNRTEVGRADRRGRYRSRLLTSTRYPLGRIITLEVTKPGLIGIHLEIRILNRSPGWQVHRTLCIPATGGKAQACGRVDRGS